MKLTKELVEAARKIHTTRLTTFDVKIGPKLIPGKEYAIPVEEIGNGNELYFWACYRWEELKVDPDLYEAYKNLKHNFCAETTSLDDSEGFEHMWLLFCCTLKAGMEPSGDYYPIGMLGILNQSSMHGYRSYTAAWIHPYMRDIGLMKGLLSHLLNKKLHLPDPPVTTAMTFAIDSVGKILDPEVRERLNKEGIDYMQKVENINLSDLSEEETVFVVSLLPAMSDDKKNQETIDALVKILRDENVVEHLKEMDLSGFSREDIIKQRNDMMNIIHAKKILEK